MNDPVHQLPLRHGVVVVGSDGSAGAAAALPWASGLTEGAGADLRVVGSWTPLQIWGWAQSEPQEGVPSGEELAATAVSTLQRAVADVVAARPVPVRDAACPVVVMPPGLTER